LWTRRRTEFAIHGLFFTLALTRRGRSRKTSWWTRGDRAKLRFDAAVTNAVQRGFGWSLQNPAVLSGNAAMPALDPPCGMLLLPAGNLRLTGDHAGHQRDVARVIGQPAFLAFASSKAGCYYEFNHNCLPIPHSVDSAEQHAKSMNSTTSSVTKTARSADEIRRNLSGGRGNDCAMLEWRQAFRKLRMRLCRRDDRMGQSIAHQGGCGGCCRATVFALRGAKFPHPRLQYGTRPKAKMR
jgi:hypothetical protein